MSRVFAFWRSCFLVLPLLPVLLFLPFQLLLVLLLLAFLLPAAVDLGRVRL